MRFNLFLLFAFIIFCGFQCDEEEIVYPKGELTVVSGRVIDTNGELITSGDIFVRPIDSELFPEGEDIFTFPIQSDGTYNISFFNEETIKWGALIGRIPDENYSCASFGIALGVENFLDITVPRHALEGRLQIIHDADATPDSLFYASNQNQCRGFSIIQSPPSFVADTLTEYDFFVDLDIPTIANFGILRDDEIFEDRFEYIYEGEIIIFEMRID